jgi:hypothetical protein
MFLFRKKKKTQDVHNIQNVEKSASKYCKLVNNLKIYIAKETDLDMLKNNISIRIEEIIAIKKELNSYLSVIQFEANKKELKEIFLGKKVASGLVDEHDKILAMIESFYDECKSNDIVIYYPESVKVVFNKSESQEIEDRNISGESMDIESSEIID